MLHLYAGYSYRCHCKLCTVVLKLVALGAVFIIFPVAAGSVEADFAAENAAAMTKMMKEMTVKPSGNVDHDFAAMMTAHHQGAIDMAQAELRYGRDEQLRRIAQQIIVEQQQEIAAMRHMLGQALPVDVLTKPQLGTPGQHHLAPAAASKP